MRKTLTSTSSSSWDQVASNYEKEIISPLLHSQHNPLFDYLKKIKLKPTLHAADIGCGTGPLLPILAQKFKEVTGIDYSKKMLKKAQQKTLHLNEKYRSKIQFKLKNIATPFRNQFDVLFAINSIIDPNPNQLEKIFKYTFSSLREGGHFLGIFPAIESIHHEYSFFYKKFMKETGSSKQAKRKTDQIMEIDRLDPLLGIYQTDDIKQKYFFRSELEDVFLGHHFQNIQVEKVIYPSECFFNFQRAPTPCPSMWDWFIFAKK